MSSSKVYKDDPSFTPVSIVSQQQVQHAPTSSTAEEHEASPQSEARPPESDHLQGPGPTDPLTPEPTSSPDLETIKREAYETGRLEAEQHLQSRLQVTLDAFSQACVQIDSLHQNLLEQSRGDMINLVIALSKKIIGRELTTGRDIIVDTLKNAIEHAIKNNEYDIWINPKDLAAVEEIVPELIRSVQQLEHITLKTDPQITRGGCKLDSSVCTVDATIEAQLETAREFLEEKSPNCNTPDLPDSPQEEAPEDQ